MTNKDQSPGRDITRRLFLKQSSILGAAAVTGILAPGNGYAAQSDGFPVVETTYGKIRGMNTAGIKTFLDVLNSGNGKPMEQMTPQEARQVLIGAQKGAKLPPAKVSDKTILVKGQEIKLNRGQTWFTVLSSKDKLIYQ